MKTTLVITPAYEYNQLEKLEAAKTASLVCISLT